MSSKTHVVKIAEGARIAPTGAYILTWCKTGGFRFTGDINEARRMTPWLAQVCADDLMRQRTCKSFSLVTVKVHQVWAEVK